MTVYVGKNICLSMSGKNTFYFIMRDGNSQPESLSYLFVCSKRHYGYDYLDINGDARGRGHTGPSNFYKT